MKPWQILLLLLVTVLGIALVVYFTTRRSSPDDGDDDDNGTMDGSAADQVEGWGNLLTGAAAGVTRLTTS